MALRLRRGTDLERIGVVFEEGELVYSTDTKRLFVGDGVTAGGIPVSDLISDMSPQLGASLDLNTYDIVGFGNINVNGDITATGTLTVPNIITDVQGSIFGDDSSPLVDGANNKIILDNNSIADLSDVNTTNVQVGDVLKWDGVNWATESPDLTLTDLTDVDTVNVQVGDVLKWDGFNWITSQDDSTLNVLDNLSDVDTGNVQVGDFLQWDGFNWIPNRTGVDIQLGDLNNVITSGVQINDIIKYDGSNWIATAGNNAIADLSDVDTVNIQPGDVLKWDGNNWVASQDDTANVLDNLSDVDLTGLQLGDILSWNGFNWVPDGGIGTIRETDIKGSIFGLDSTLLVDGEISKITGDIFNVEVLTNRIEINFVNGSSNDILSLQKEYNAEVTSFDFLGEQRFSYTDPTNGNIVVNTITATTAGLFIFTGGSPTDPLFNPLPQSEKVISVESGKLGISKFTPTEALDVVGNVTTTGFVQFGRYTTVERDDLTTTNSPQYATNWGMVIYNTDTNTFQGWQNTGGTTPEWVNLS